jgi:hypothetical protein
MSHAETIFEAKPRPHGAASNGLALLGVLALLGAGGGVLLALMNEVLAGPTNGLLAWPAPGSGLPLVGAGAAGVLGAGWTMLALWRLKRGRGTGVPGFAGLAAGGLVAGALATVVGCLPTLAAAAGLDMSVALVLGALEALVAGLWLTDLFASLTARGITEGLAVEVWLLFGCVVALPAQLPTFFPALVGLMVSIPLLSVSILARGEERPGPAVGWLAAGFLLLPLALGASLQLSALAA